MNNAASNNAADAKTADDNTAESIQQGEHPNWLMVDEIKEQKRIICGDIRKVVGM